MARKKRRKPVQPQLQNEAGLYVDWTLDNDGRLVAVDEVEHRLAIEQPDGRFAFIGGKGTAPGSFHYPSGVEIHRERAYVVDSWNHRVQMFSLPSWKYEGAFGSFGDSAGEFACPSGIAAVESGSDTTWLAVADTNNRRLSFHDIDGRCLFVTDLPHSGFPRKLRVSTGTLEVRYESGPWEAV